MVRLFQLSALLTIYIDIYLKLWITKRILKYNVTVVIAIVVPEGDSSNSVGADLSMKYDGVTWRHNMGRRGE